MLTVNESVTLIFQENFKYVDTFNPKLFNKHYGLTCCVYKTYIIYKQIRANLESKPLKNPLILSKKSHFSAAFIKGTKTTLNL